TQSGHPILRIVATQNDGRNPIPSVVNPCCNHIVGVVLSLGKGDATTRFHKSNYRYSDGLPLPAYAQRAARKVQRIGIIDDSSNWDPFRQQLRELNYVEGENLTYVYLRTDGSPAQLDAAASALAQIPVNVIIAFGTPRAQAAQRATKTIPIVAISIGDPIAAGLVTSLAHPGGNITGNTILGPDVVTKRLQILKDAIPAVTRVAYLWNPDNPATADILEHLRKAAPLFHMTVVSLEARTVVDFDRA